MTAPRLLVGVDGGNTKTVAIAATPDGTILGTSRVARRADIHHVPVDTAVAVHHEAVDRALAAVPTPGQPAAAPDSIAIALSLAGADWPEDIALLEERHRRRWPGAVVVNDAIGALRAAIPAGSGVVIVCGTGTATGARGPDGRTWHSSFWQEVQGAHELGVRLLQAVYRAELGIDPPTTLTDRVLAATGEPNVEALLHHATRREAVAPREPGDLAWILLDAAEGGDPTAQAIVDRHGAALAATALAAARQVGIRPGTRFRLALTGGVLRRSGAALRDAIVRGVRIDRPEVEVVPPADDPAVGALLLAFDAAGIVVDDAIHRRIRAGLSSADLFDTHPAKLATA